MVVLWPRRAPVSSPTGSSAVYIGTAQRSVCGDEVADPAYAGDSAPQMGGKTSQRVRHFGTTGYSDSHRPLPFITPVGTSSFQPVGATVCPRSQVHPPSQRRGKPPLPVLTNEDRSRRHRSVSPRRSTALANCGLCVMNCARSSCSCCPAARLPLTRRVDPPRN